MGTFIVEGGTPLRGHVRPAGNKNAALPMMAAALLTEEPVRLSNVPDIRDVHTMLELLEALGVRHEWEDRGALMLEATEVRSAALEPGLTARIRASILLAGPMFARTHQVRLPPPGGDVIGRRRLDTHFDALQKLGAEVELGEGFVIRGKPRAGDVFLDEPSVTATENAIMAAVLAPGTTRLRNVAAEPHVQDLCGLLNAMGARISGIGTGQLTIEGVERLSGASFAVSPDHIEVGSFIGLAAVTHADLTIGDVVPDHLRGMRLMFERLGVYCQLDGQTLRVPAEQSLEICMDVGGQIPKIDDGPWPLFPADLMSIALVVATQCRGTVLIHEKMFESRMFFADKLTGMGARIVICDPHRAVVVGPATLRGSVVESPDIRAGMAILIAALGARGRSEIHNIGQIERGYERIDERLRQLGASIERVE
ncbi:MAG: UDP-N-acetylglucosamine 1-carboxyvinyltransferase [Gemmatimonadetes bacterium]|uniref:UDP-N-acetylglucosamine 1-carboxyvinyltransferase n=1 Tax=Candidatus Kutchimonas denitrificans TaxID=3056748 RepID=A0AAE4ZAB2_9BACT|nr:UDP-N-acetylglucosamine 1-carboxyvinyltransferase [Gemmatimonadota bacterium]NIR76219.1 UDP-N-acetylglucosamine 1-carboxyvinyltransferase [Candidatus Kutchimonas denitrificans]NIS00659.1 UDP-N-acetylglucosamine 1-carboxyvinyltransferase [Gemmatimonadota bacterium]NIT66804.1 UDP-N-acetylglucosamine 1-carboxyvinyltransferase [Gemmatimonadota bacterium]NIV23403.1 UDP-N-acetylglucosamine 1-carboxyvinyltransferase [Gemmatimonadota bacterium]